MIEFLAERKADFYGMNFSADYQTVNENLIWMSYKVRPAKNNRGKQLDFVSRLTFIKGLKDVPERQHQKERKEKKKRKFKTWVMPVQPVGYIKCRDYDFF